MIQLQILSGKKAGHEIVVRRFPFQIGRQAEAQLRLEDEGVWDRHLELGFSRGDGYCFTSRCESPALLNGQHVERGMLRNGDLIELGSVRLRFWLARSQQKSMRVREVVTWWALLLIFILQAALIFILLR